MHINRSADEPEPDFSRERSYRYIRGYAFFRLLNRRRFPDAGFPLEWKLGRNNAATTHFLAFDACKRDPLNRFLKYVESIPNFYIYSRVSEICWRKDFYRRRFFCFQSFSKN